MVSDTLLRIEDLHISFDTPRGALQALCGVSLAVRAGEIFGLVGETGCGKSITSLAVLQLVPRPGEITSGRILFRGENLLAKSEAEMRQVRGAEIAMIFQDPYTSLNPVFLVGSQIMRVLRQHYEVDKREARSQILEMLQAVGLPDVERVFKSYPHELSGGMQQRVMIAMALVCRPALLIADEPTTALDVTIQAQILRLLRELCESLGITIMLITHDLGVISEICDRMAVLYAGRVVEMASTSELFTSPQHPYTQGLMAAIPQPERRGQPLQAIPGTVPGNPGAVVGCAFASRCPRAFERCHQEEPDPVKLKPGHTSACYLSEKGEGYGS